MKKYLGDLGPSAADIVIGIYVLLLIFSFCIIYLHFLSHLFSYMLSFHFYSI